MRNLLLPLALLGSITSAYCQQGTAPDGQLDTANLLKNGDFETVERGSIADWGGVPFSVTSSSEVRSNGEHSLQLSSGGDDFEPTAAQNVSSFSYGQKYRLQYKARAAKFGQEYRVYVGLWDDSQPDTAKRWTGGVDTRWRQGLQEWQDVSVDFTVEKPVNRLMVVMQIKGAGAMWFDDISLAPAVAPAEPEPIPPFVGSAATVQIRPDRTFRVAGKPFFPIAIWGWRPDTDEAMAAARDWGFNIVSPTHIDALGPQGFRLWLDAAQRHGLMVNATTYFGFEESVARQILPAKMIGMRRAIEPNKDHPAIFSYVLADEPAWSGHSIDAFATGARLIRSLDPNRPIFVNHAPRNSIAELQKYNRYVDIAGSDIYPVWKTGIDRHSDLPNKTIGVVGDETTKNIAAVDGKKPVMETLQAFSWSDGPNAPAGLQGEPFPSAVQLRFMAYHAIVRGATGIAFFQDGRYSTLRSELKPIVRELNSMSDILAGGTVIPPGEMTGPQGLEWSIRERNGAHVAIVLNPSAATIAGEFSCRFAAKATMKRMQVLAERRSLTLRDEKFQDTFGPWEVHIYSDAPDLHKILRSIIPSVPKTLAQPASSARKPAWQEGLNALAPKPNENLALSRLGVKAIASSDLEGMRAALLNDGDRWGAQWNDGTHYSYPDWAGLEFPAPVTVGRVVIFSHELNIFGRAVSDGIRDFELQVKQEGQWKTLQTVKGGVESAYALDIKPAATTSELRVLITATNGSGDWSRIREIEVYGER